MTPDDATRHPALPNEARYRELLSRLGGADRLGDLGNRLQSLVRLAGELRAAVGDAQRQAVDLCADVERAAAALKWARVQLTPLNVRGEVVDPHAKGGAR